MANSMTWPSPADSTARETGQSRSNDTMNANQYHRMALGLDQVLLLFNEASTELSADDVQLKHQLETIRSQFLKAESRQSLPSNTESAFATGTAADSDLTMAPWQKDR